ncbi:MAG: TRAP transporter substrate-binding protein DctP [Burkholderiaceae bacterium]
MAADNNALFEAVKTGVLQGMFFVGTIQHDANIIHSKVPITSLAEMKGKKIRLPGGMVSEVFQQFGVSTVALPGSDIFPALEKGTIDAADFVGPAVNYDLGFHQVTKYILMGPPGSMSLYQPVDLMDLTVNMGAWKRLSPKMQAFVEEQVKAYSLTQYVAIQKANVDAMAKFAAAGSQVSRLTNADTEKFRLASVPIWFNWARKDADAARVFKLQLEYMKNGVLGYVDDAMLKGQKI